MVRKESGDQVAGPTPQSAAGNNKKNRLYHAMFFVCDRAKQNYHGNFDEFDIILSRRTMNKRCCIVLASCVFVMFAAHAQAQSDYSHTASYLVDPSGEPREHPLDITSMKLEVSFEPEKSLVHGRVEHTFTVLQKSVDSLVFDGIAMNIQQTLLNGRPARYTVNDSSVTVYCEKPLAWTDTGSVLFTYTAQPQKGLYFIGWNDPTGTMRRQIWSQGQAIDHRHWIPLYDEMNDKMLTEAIITFDSAYTVISNGQLVGVTENSGATRTWRYRMKKPHASYLFMIAIGKYAVTKDTTSTGVLLEQYWYPDRPQDAEPTYRLSKESMDFLEQETGVPYPWEIYRQVPVADFVFGAMENTTATIFGDFFLNDARGWLDRSYVGVNVHELTHQWFGDLITARSSRSEWLQESFATYYPLIFTRQTHGTDEYEWVRRGMQKSVLAAGEKDRFPVVHVKAGTTRIYPKGALVLDMMSTVFGHDELRRVIHHYLKKHEYRNVETNDLYLAFQDTLGLSPRWFFDQWLYKGGEPAFDITMLTGARNVTKGSEAVTTLTVQQTQLTDSYTGWFKMPVVCEVYYTDASKDSVTAWVNGQTTTIEIPNPRNGQVQFVLFDPGSAILKKVNFKKPFDMLLAQSRKAPKMIDRYDALTELAADSVHTDQLFDVLQDIVANEKHYAMRMEAVSIAAKKVQNGNDQFWQIIKAGFQDKHVEVRRRAVGSSPEIPASLKPELAELLSDSSYRIVEQAYRKLCTWFPTEADRFTNRVAGVRSPGAIIEIAIAEQKAGTADKQALATLSDYASRRYDFGTRQNAFASMVRLGTTDLAGMVAVVDALESRNGRLAQSAKDTLQKLAAQLKMQALARTILQSEPLSKEQKAFLQILVN